MDSGEASPFDLKCLEDSVRRKPFSRLCKNRLNEVGSLFLGNE